MALFGGKRDVSLIRTLNRELIGDIISQQCAFYKYKLGDTQPNIYGEAVGPKFYIGPTLVSCLIKHTDFEFSSDEMIGDFKWEVIFKFLADDLVRADLVAEIGDIILYKERYFEIDNVNSIQLFLGKDPDYPNESNPLNPGLASFGYNVSIICKTHYTSAEKLGINKNERL